jgi:MraZ protein
MFLSTYVNKVDRKGRVSVPATFRALLAKRGFASIFVIPSFKHPALEASGMDRMEEIGARVNRLPQYSEEHEMLSWMFARAQELPFDPEGRIVLPQRLAAYAGITDSAAFVGLGQKFEIWEPARYEEHDREQLERARSRGATLPPLDVAGQPPR